MKMRRMGSNIEWKPRLYVLTIGVGKYYRISTFGISHELNKFVDVK